VNLLQIHEPGATPDHTTLYGLVVSTPRLVAPWKNSTCVTRPSESEALAASVIAAGAAYWALAAGEVSTTEGGALTVMDTGADVTAAPESSVTFAVSTYVPAAAPDHVIA